MRALGLVLQIAVPVISAATLGWWLATLLMRLMLRRSERGRTMAAGPPSACAALLAGQALVTALAAGAVAALTLWALTKLAGAAGAPPDQPLVHAWHILLNVAFVLAVGAAVAAAAAQALGAMASARRRWELLGLEPPPPATGVPCGEPIRPDTAPGGRRIVILCDGTSNRPDETEDGIAATTNVYKLSQALVSDEAQTIWYQAGVGSDTSSTARQARRTQAFLSFVGANAGSQAAATWRRVNQVIEGVFGTGISETIVNGYTEIVRQYRPGDRIYLVGFSRGAYAARCIAAVIARCGLLHAGNVRYAREVVQIYRCRSQQDRDSPVVPALVHPDPEVEFVGVFDTVASLGVPLWGWWFRASPIWDNKPLMTDPVRICKHVYHALAMDEQRSEFVPTLYTWPEERRPNDKLATLRQVWFRGAHADIGGGYARTDLSDITLGWMMDAMAHHGLRFHGAARAALKPNPFGRLHDELDRRPFWQVLGSWPRWHPTPGGAPDPAGTTLHPSVLAREAAFESRAGRFGMHRLGVGEDLVFTAEAHRAWHSPGVVIETGALYRLTWLGGHWRDASAPPCGPGGQEAGPRDMRRWWKWNRRLQDRPWMQLVVTVAHPRHWKLHEYPLRKLLPLLFGNDPPELRSQLAPIGPALVGEGAAVLLQSHAPGGLLHLFANDWWQTASNNSGGLKLRIERVAEGVPTLTLNANGTWERPAPAATAPP